MILAALLLAAQPMAQADTERTKTAYRAHRAPLCSEWSTVRRGGSALRPMEAAYNNWFHGYVSGFNVFWHPRSGDILGSITWNEVANLIDAQCKQNPMGSVSEALDPVLADLIERQAHKSQGMPQPSILTVRVTCRQWTEAKDDRLLRVVWGGAARGYITAYNRWGRDLSGDALLANNDALIDQWIDDWCSKRPTLLMMQSMTPFIKHIGKERDSGRLTPGQTPANEQIIQIPKA